MRLENDTQLCQSKPQGRETDKGVHLLEKGIAIGQGVYQIAKTLAPLAAAAMV